MGLLSVTKMWDMWMLQQLLIITGITLLLIVSFRYLSHKGRLPPGPPAVPILGSIPFMGSSDLLQGLANMQRKYGDIYTFYMGSLPTVMLNNYDLIKEAFVTKGAHLVDRPQGLFYCIEIAKGCGILTTEGKLWKEQRRFSLRVLRELGMGKNVMESKIQEEASRLITSLKKHVGRPQNLTWPIMVAVSSVISSIMFNRSYDHNDQEFQHFVKRVSKDFVAAAGPASPLSLVPILRYLPGDFFKYQTFRRIMDDLQSFIHGHIKDHVKTHRNDDVRDFMDVFISEMKKNEGSKDSSFHENQLIILTLEMFLAGSETTTTTLLWVLYLMAKHPDIQAKVQEEILQTIGLEQKPTMQDKIKMPYTEATLMEIQRFGTTVPLSTFHQTTENIKLGDWTVPKGISVLANLYCVHNDPNLWDIPERFNPDRFLGEDGKVDHKESLIMFSIGKRSCLGESLARMQLFIFFTTLLQNYTIAFSTVTTPPDDVGKGFYSGVTRAPKDFQVVLQPKT